MVNRVALGEIVKELENGSRPEGGVNDDGDVFSIGGEHLNNLGGFDFSSVKLISRDFYNQMKRGKIKPADIIIVKDGATTGKTSFVNEQFPHFPCAINEHVFRLAVNQKAADPRYVFYYLYSPKGNKEILDDFRGATVGGISQDFVNKVFIPLPPLEEQKRIASLLARADRLRGLRRAAREQCDSLLQSVFLEMFGEYLKPSHPFTPMEKLVKITGGGTPSRDVPEYFTGNIPWLTSKDMRGDYIYDTQEHITEKAIKESATNLVPVGSILLVVKSKILMRRLPIAVTKVPLCHGQDIKSIQCSNKINSLFLVYVLKYNEQNLLNQARGANTEGLTLPMLNEIKVPNVPLSLQEEFAGVVARVETLRARMDESARQGEALFQSLLAESFG